MVDLRFISRPALGLLALFTLAGAAPIATDLAPLRIHANGRVLFGEADRPVFLLADTAWSLVARLSREDADLYLRKRKSQGFNAVTFVLAVPNGTELTREPTNFYGALPFERVNNHFDPARPITTAGSDPENSRQYDYWDHVDYVIGRMRSHGLYAILLPTWGTGIAGSYDGKDTKDIIFDAPKAAAYSGWLAERYGSRPHVLWMIGGDRSAVYGENDYRPAFRALASGFVRLAPTQLLSFHPRKAAPQSGDWFHRDSWLAFNSNQHWPERQVEAIAADWAREPAKPTWLFEGRYEGYWRGNAKPGDWGAWQVRQQAYQTVFAGAFGHTYGHERVFGFGTDGVDWKTFLDAPGALAMSHLARLMEAFQPDELLTRLPDQALLATPPTPPERLRSDYIAATRSDSGSIAMFYSASGQPIEVRLDKLPATARFAFWFNPRNGQWHREGSESPHARAFATDVKGGRNAAARAFIPPTSGDNADWVLVLASRPSLSPHGPVSPGGVAL